MRYTNIKLILLLLLYLSFNSKHVHLIDERLGNFKVGLTNTSPQVQAPAVGNYDVCASVSDPVGLGETKNMGFYITLLITATKYEILFSYMYV